MRRATFALLVLLAACSEKKAPSKPAAPAPPPPSAPTGREAPRAPVTLPANFDGYVAIRGDDQALAMGNYSDGAGTVVVRVIDIAGRTLFTQPLETPGATINAKSYLVSNGFHQLVEHPPDKYVEATPAVVLEGGKIRVRIGPDSYEATPPLPPSKDAQVELAGWAPDGGAMVVRMRASAGEFGKAVGYAIIPVKP